MTTQAAPALPATPEVSLALVGPLAEALAQDGLRRFEEAIQRLLDAPLDAALVLEWTRLRSAASL
jgi:hypothetical protein